MTNTRYTIVTLDPKRGGNSVLCTDEASSRREADKIAARQRTRYPWAIVEVHPSRCGECDACQEWLLDPSSAGPCIR